MPSSWELGRSETVGWRQQPLSCAQVSIVSFTDRIWKILGISLREGSHGTHLSSVPWKCITGTGRLGCGSSMVMMAATGAMAAIRSAILAASR